MKLYNRHAFETFDVPPNNRDVCFSGVQHTLQYSVGVAKLSVERGFLIILLRGGRITIH